MGTQRFQLRVSAGIDHNLKDSAGIHDLLQHADVSRYAAKRAGGSRHLRLVPLPLQISPANPPMMTRWRSPNARR